MKTFFQEKFEYNFECNNKMIALMLDSPASYSERARILFCHTLNAQNIWNHRLLEISPSQNVWDIFDLSELKTLNEQNHQKSLDILNKLDLKASIEYRNTEGNSFTNSVEHILFHIINHSTYHRGQLMSELKAQGVSPIATDFIFFKR